ncbi:adrenocortical dysplasia protein homolog isoform 2-T2 [Clarias gariepinus]|uniref:adrenocortical dysplasia protein homolog isoform X2 n=1 Tax=Clarias gariepinus TaxID=13013 RepID=UPI00234D87B6|nr:adrenocortical dysplasia protein homolog isoform X2 [Clarias gariepinus]
MRRFRAEGEPEPWIEQLVQSYSTEQERELSVRAHVVGVSELTESQRTDDSDACMLFLSDGTVFIPAVLSAAAWERMQELEERDTFSSLDNTTVSVRKFQLNFHMDPELTTCQFYITVHQIVSVGRVSRHPRPPSCTMLPSVRQQILKTWRSLMKENSVTSLASQSQSAFPLSCLMGAWHNDIIMDLLNDAIKKIGTPTEGHLRTATPTHWHRERLRCRDEPCFSTPVSHLLIPEEQREMLTADPGVSGSSETPSGLVLPETIERPITVQDRAGDSPSVASDRPLDARQLTLNNTRAGGGESGERESPWDMFCPAADLLVTPSSASESSLESLSQTDNRSLLAIGGSAEESTIVVPPFQRPPPSPHSPAHPSDPTITDLQEKPQTPPSPLTSSEQAAIMGVEEQFPIDTSQKTPHPHQVSHTPPTKKRHVHSDGSSFSYTYEPCPIIASALSQYKVPEQVVQWAAAYLGTPQQTLIVSSGVELKEVAVKK